MTSQDWMAYHRHASFSENLLNHVDIEPSYESIDPTWPLSPVPEHGASSGDSTRSEPSQPFFRTLWSLGGSDKRNAEDAAERSPLLGADTSSEIVTSHTAVESRAYTTWKQETWIIVKYSAPLIITFVLQYSITATSVFVVGRLGAIELGAVSLGNMSAAISCLTPFQGLATSLDTLCSQAFGSGDNHLVGLHCQRLTLFLLALSVPVAVLWTFSESIFMKILPDPRTAMLAGTYLRVLVFGLPGIVFLETGKRFLQAQCLFRATTYVLLIVTPLNIFLHWFLIWKMELGFIGAPISAALIMNLIPFLLFLYVLLIDGSGCWGGFSRRAFSNWPTMFGLALPAMLMLEAEWLAFELITLFSSRFGTDYLAAQSVLGTLSSLTYQIPFPLSIAISTRIAHLIGAGEVEAARRTARVAIGAVSVVGLINFSLYALLRYQLAALFTTDERVISLTAAILPLIAMVQLLDAVSAGAHGLLRGLGRQWIGGPANLFSYYIIGMPVALGLVLGRDWKLDGMWTGIAVGQACVTIVEYAYLIRIDWDEAADEAWVRNAAG